MTFKPDIEHSSILIVDDDVEILYLLKELLSETGYVTFQARSAKESQVIFSRESIDVVLLDINMPQVSGVTVLENFKKERPDTIIIMISAVRDIDLVVKCMQKGAYDYLVKPIFDLNQVRIRIRNALLERATRRENLALRQNLIKSKGLEKIIGKSAGMVSVMNQIQMVAPHDSTVMIGGASGTGKELIASSIHNLSKRAGGPFIAVNCGSVPAGLLESTLFGHEKGAFTGAAKRNIGLFEQSNHGTIFLDEITETSPDFQVRLLRVLETGSIRRVGGSEEILLDLRILAATNKDIAEMVDRKEFREDLYYRLNVFAIRIPELKERKEDIVLLTDYYLKTLIEKMKVNPKKINPEVYNIFQAYPWPGNVRELINTLESAIIRCEGEKIEIHNLPDNFKPYRSLAAAGKLLKDYKESLTDFEYEYFSELLIQTNGNITKAAERAGISRQHFHKKMKILNLTGNG